MPSSRPVEAVAGVCLHNFGLAFIAIPPSGYANAAFYTHLTTRAPTARPTITINGDTSLQAREVAGAIIKHENLNYHLSTADASAPCTSTPATARTQYCGRLAPQPSPPRHHHPQRQLASIVPSCRSRPVL